MKQSINLAMYGINIKTEDSEKKKSKSHILDKIPQYNNPSLSYDLLNILNNIFSNFKESTELYKNENEETDTGKRIYLSEYHELKEFNKRGIYGIVKFGYYGNEREVKDVTKAITTENNKIIDENEGVFNPYYFLIVIPKNLDQGYLILEQKRGLGIKSIFKNVFLDSLTKYTEYSNYKIELSRVFPEELKKKFL